MKGGQEEVSVIFCTELSSELNNNEIRAISLIKAGCGNATPARPLDLETSSMAQFEGLDLRVAENSQ